MHTLGRMVSPGGNPLVEQQPRPPCIDSRFQPSSLMLPSKNGISRLISVPPWAWVHYREHDPAAMDGRLVEIVSLGYCDTRTPVRSYTFENRAAARGNKEVRSPSLLLGLRLDRVLWGASFRIEHKAPTPSCCALLSCCFCHCHCCCR